jgi:2-keto-4-pentenoate hydratase/2-oxohepta-3-ene-1,7-dioic acid hydratase in catechol pathway
MSAMLVRFSETASKPLRPGLMVGDDIADISAHFPDVHAFLASHPNGWPADPVLPKGASRFARSSVRLGPPIDPGSIVYAVGANYRQHAEEAGLSVPKQPVIFSKPYTALVGAGEAISIPPVSSQLDYEGEMAVVIGKNATRVTAAEAARYVAGVTILNDTTARDLQWVELGKNRIVDWFASKCLDRSSPLGPGIASIKTIPDVHRMRLRTQLNGEVMQDADTSLMVFDTWQLIAFASAHATLRAGDVLATGTPFGVGGFRNIFLKPGDVVRIELENVGVLENAVA